jgi:hypothetical protein
VGRAVAPRYPSRSWFKNGESGALERAPRHEADRHPGDGVDLRGKTSGVQKISLASSNSFARRVLSW